MIGRLLSSGRLGEFEGDLLGSHGLLESARGSARCR